MTSIRYRQQSVLLIIFMSRTGQFNQSKEPLVEHDVAMYVYAHMYWFAPVEYQF